MKGIQIDSRNRTARVGSGVTWGEFDTEAQRYGLATTGGRVSSTGVAGSPWAAARDGWSGRTALPATT